MRCRHRCCAGDAAPPPPLWAVVAVAAAISPAAGKFPGDLPDRPDELPPALRLAFGLRAASCSNRVRLRSSASCNSANRKRAVSVRSIITPPRHSSRTGIKRSPRLRGRVARAEAIARLVSVPLSARAPGVWTRTAVGARPAPPTRRSLRP
eukprot:ctg_105.g26